MSNDKKYYQERRLWFRRYLDAKERGDDVGRRKAFKKLLQLTDNKFDGADPNK
jgi:hypothetical protein